MIDKEKEWKIIEKKIMDQIDFLTKNEEKELEELIGSGFSHFNTKHFQSYIRCCCEYGKNNINEISKHVDGKSENEVIAYHKVFWKKI